MPKVIILRAPGTNCDQETAFAFRAAGSQDVDILHVNRVLERPDLLDSAQILCIPGGFSFGDDIAAGRVFASKLDNHLSEQLDRFKESDKLILGICNGFQVLLKSGLLFPGTVESNSPATLTWNQNPLYTDRWVRLKAGDTNCVFLRGLDKLYLPVAHAEGRFVVSTETESAGLTLKKMQEGRQLALCYHPDDNPNGSVADVAGVCDSSGRVFGLMPHPERFLDALHHPQWTRHGTTWSTESELPPGDGLAIFRNAVTYFR